MLNAASPLTVTEDQRLARLEMLADLWGKIYLFHPRIVTTRVDWAGVLLETIPKVERAADTDELIAVLNQSLFRPLDDPLTRAQRHAASRRDAGRPITARKLSPTVAYIDATDPSGYGSEPTARAAQLMREAGPVDLVVVDLRFAAPALANVDWLRLFLRSAETTGGRVARVHDGWREDNTLYLYRQKWMVDPGVTLQPLAGSQSIATPLVVVVNRPAYDIAAGILDLLQSASRALVLFENRGDFHPAFNAGFYPEDVEARLNLYMVPSRSGHLGAEPDYVSDRPITDTELPELAAKIAERRVSHSAPRRSISFDMIFPGAEPPSTAPLSRGRRLLGLFKIWTVIAYLDPHVQRASIDWQRALRDWILRVEAAETLADYYSVLARLGAKLNDSHVTMTHPALTAQTIVPLKVRLIEGKPIVVGVIGEPSGNLQSVRIGDELVAVNGKRMEESLAETEAAISASTPGALRRELLFPSLNGYGRDAVDVLLRNDSGSRSVTLKPVRFQVRGETWGTPSPSPSYKTIGGRVGYIDLRTLVENEVDSALAALAATDGLILDMRGFPRFPIWTALIPHFIDKPIPTNRAEVPMRSGAAPASRMTRELVATFEPNGTLRYSKPLVVLVDERTQSAAEHFCINLKGAKRATFVGSTTAGADGDVARIGLPGGGVMTFTGSVVTFGDGGAFQNIGIVPDVKVEPTIRGIRAGRDEVLEKGIEVLRSLR